MGLKILVIAAFNIMQQFGKWYFWLAETGICRRFWETVAITIFVRVLGTNISFRVKSSNAPSLIFICHLRNAYISISFPWVLECIYVCTYVCMNVCLFVFMHICMHVRMYVCMHACMHVCMHVLHVFMSVCMFVCMWLILQCHFSCWVTKRKICGTSESKTKPLTPLNVS